MDEPVISISALTRRFGARTALDGADLSVQRGAVYGLVGANGAGKTTLIKHILGLLRAQSGSVRVFGHDPVADPVAVLSRIGYLSEDPDLPAWMTVEELSRYSRAFYPRWDVNYADELLQMFALDRRAKIKTLSKGQKARAGLLTALAHRPELLVLDEPSSGLDPIVRRDILAAVMRTVAEDGRTVLFSSHLLDEVQQVADHVAMIRQGRIVFSAPLTAMIGSHRCIRVRFAEAPREPPAVAAVLRWDGAGHDWTAVVLSGSRELDQLAGVSVVAEREASLDEIFVAHAGSSCNR